MWGLNGLRTRPCLVRGESHQAHGEEHRVVLGAGGHTHTRTHIPLLRSALVHKAATLVGGVRLSIRILRISRRVHVNRRLKTHPPFFSFSLIHLFVKKTYFRRVKLRLKRANDCYDVPVRA